MPKPTKDDGHVYVEILNNCGFELQVHFLNSKTNKLEKTVVDNNASVSLESYIGEEVFIGYERANGELIDLSKDKKVVLPKEITGRKKDIQQILVNVVTVKASLIYFFSDWAQTMKYFGYDTTSPAAAAALALAAFPPADTKQRVAMAQFINESKYHVDVLSSLGDLAGLSGFIVDTFNEYCKKKEEECQELEKAIVAAGEEKRLPEEKASLYGVNKYYKTKEEELEKAIVAAGGINEYYKKKEEELEKAIVAAGEKKRLAGEQKRLHLEKASLYDEMGRAAAAIKDRQEQAHRVRALPPTEVAEVQQEGQHEGQQEDQQQLDTQRPDGNDAGGDSGGEDDDGQQGDDDDYVVQAESLELEIENQKKLAIKNLKDQEAFENSANAHIKFNSILEEMLANTKMLKNSGNAGIEFKSDLDAMLAKTKRLGKLAKESSDPEIRKKYRKKFKSAVKKVKDVIAASKMDLIKRIQD